MRKVSGVLFLCWKLIGSLPGGVQLSEEVLSSLGFKTYHIVCLFVQMKLWVTKGSLLEFFPISFVMLQDVLKFCSARNENSVIIYSPSNLYYAELKRRYFEECWETVLMTTDFHFYGPKKKKETFLKISSFMIHTIYIYRFRTTWVRVNDDRIDI